MGGKEKKMKLVSRNFLDEFLTVQIEKRFEEFVGKSKKIRSVCSRKKITTHDIYIFRKRSSIPRI
jgi:hypothetical protein